MKFSPYYIYCTISKHDYTATCLIRYYTYSSLCFTPLTGNTFTTFINCKVFTNKTFRQSNLSISRFFKIYVNSLFVSDISAITKQIFIVCHRRDKPCISPFPIVRIALRTRFAAYDFMITLSIRITDRYLFLTYRCRHKAANRA